MVSRFLAKYAQSAAQLHANVKTLVAMVPVKRNPVKCVNKGHVFVKSQSLKAVINVAKGHVYAKS
jgi:hypothetical protein